MNKAEALTRKFGSNIGQSIGIRSRPSSQKTSDVIPMSTKDQGKKRMREAGYMEIDRIVPDPNQPRKEFSEEKLRKLGSSIERFGQLQPIVIRWEESLGKHVIVAGERRYRACKMIGKPEIACIFSEDGSIPESELMLRQLTENVQRDELAPMDAAKAFQKLQTDEGWTAIQIAEALSISKGLVSQRLKLLQLPEEIQAKVELGAITGAHGYQLTRVNDPEEQQSLANRIESEGLSRDATIEAVEKSAGKDNKRKSGKPGRPVTRKEFKLSKCKVTFSFNKKRVTVEDLEQAYQELNEAMKAA